MEKSIDFLRLEFSLIILGTMDSKRSRSTNMFNNNSTFSIDFNSNLATLKPKRQFYRIQYLKVTTESAEKII